MQQMLPIGITRHFILGIGVTALVFTILILMDFLTNDAPYWIGTGIGKITILIAIVLPTVKFIQSERKEVGEYEVRKENNRKAVEECMRVVNLIVMCIKFPVVCMVWV